MLTSGFLPGNLNIPKPIDAGMALLFLVYLLCRGDPTSATLCTPDALDSQTLSVLHLHRVHGVFPSCVQNARQLQTSCNTSCSICAERTVAVRWIVANSVHSIVRAQYADFMSSLSHCLWLMTKKHSIRLKPKLVGPAETMDVIDSDVQAAAALGRNRFS